MTIRGEMLRNKIYTIRGQRVMLDYDLAEIYGYETKSFNRQVKNNIEKFEGEEFMFQLTREEVANLVRSNSLTSRMQEVDFVRCKKCTSRTEEVGSVKCQNGTSRAEGFFTGQDGGTRYLPYAFTEQGIYMLMTVLRGPLAVRQSRALVILFKNMKDYILENHGGVGKYEESGEN
ncbi:ORF6N domain-containing protein [Candidatus Saccharibacteria bacterium]|nr:ORF6N domain-containing protein [Candidatus Saccharibacteria bacterium]